MPDSPVCALHNDKVIQFDRELLAVREVQSGMEARLRETETCTAVLTTNQTTLTLLVSELKTALEGMSNQKSNFMWEIARAVTTAIIIYALFKGGNLLS
jgi:hypothetical protein